MFEYLIEDFKTYKPLFSAIKNEYEMMLSHQRELIRQMEPLKVSQITGAIPTSKVNSKREICFSKKQTKKNVSILLQCSENNAYEKSVIIHIICAWFFC